MALSINSADNLASDLTFLLAVDDDNQIKELVSNLALTVHANVVINGTTAPYGRAFRTGGTGTTPWRVSFAPVAAPSNAPISVFIVMNDWVSKTSGSASTGGMLFGGEGGSVKIGPGIMMYNGGIWQPNSGQSSVAAVVPTAGNVATGANSIGFVRSGTTTPVPKAFINGVLDANYSSPPSDDGVSYGSKSSTASFASVGGGATNFVTADFVYVAVFVGVALTDADFLRLHNSLTGGNAFALVTSSGGGADVESPVLTGSIDVTGITSTSFSAAWSAGTDNVAVVGYDMSLDGGTTWQISVDVPYHTPSGLTASTTYQVRVRAKDAVGNFSTPSLSAAVTTSAAPSTYVALVGPMYLTTGSGPALNTPVSWSAVAADVGDYEGATITDGSGVTDPTTGVLTVQPLPSAATVDVIVKDGSGAVFYQRVTPG